MTDTEFLNWVADRLEVHYNEGPVDFVVKLRRIANYLSTINPEDVCAIRSCTDDANSMTGGIGPLCDYHSELIHG